MLSISVICGKRNMSEGPNPISKKVISQIKIYYISNER